MGFWDSQPGKGGMGTRQIPSSSSHPAGSSRGAALERGAEAGVHSPFLWGGLEGDLVLFPQVRG